MPVLSICIPTKNREAYLKTTLERITQSKEFTNSDDIEIVISDNCSDDGTQALCEKYASKYKDKILYVRQKQNISDRNYTEVLRYARGKFAKLNNDTLWYTQGSLSKMVDILRKNEDVGLVFFTNEENPEKKIVYCKNATEFFIETSYKSTWIAGVCVNRKIYDNIGNLEEYSGTGFIQIAVCAKLATIAPSMVVYERFMNVTKIYKKGSYNIAQTFGESYLSVIKKLENEEIITDEVYSRVLKPLLVDHITPYYFNLNNEYGFKKTGYFKYLLKYYKKHPYLYTSYLHYTLKAILRKILSVTKTENHKIYCFLGLFKFQTRKKHLSKKYWRKKNAHNQIYLRNYNYQNKVSAGKNSYGCIDALFDGNDNNNLFIGNYVSIANDVLFIISSDHNYKNISTFPFKAKCIDGEKEALSKGDIVVGDDVWIGTRSIILSGVTINQGAVVAAGSIVTKDVPPYAIVGGNPAQVIKYRFSPEIIEKLKKIDYSKLSEDKIREHIEDLYTEISEDNIDNIIEVLDV